MSTPSQLYLLDAYALIYRAYFPHSKRPRIDSQGRDTSAVFGFVNTLGEILNSFSPEYIAVVFDPPGGSFRSEIYPEYKAHREKTPEPISFAIPYIKQILEAYGIPIIMREGYEADDVIGTLSVQAEQAGLEVLMITPDKDYAQLVTPHVSVLAPQRGGGYLEMGVQEVREKYGFDDPKQMIDYLALMGDASDNIPGIAGVGPKTAQDLLNTYGSIEAIYLNLDKLRGKLLENLKQGYDNALLSRQLATICTSVPDIELDLSACKHQAPDYSALLSIYEELEFRTLSARLKSKHAQELQTAVEAPSPLAELFAHAGAGGETESTEIATASEQEEAIRWTLLDSTESLSDFISKALSHPHLCLDTETTGLDALNAELVGMSFALDAEQGYYLPIPEDREEAQKVLETLRPLLERPSLKIGQNIKYDLQILHRYGITLGGAYFDTMIADYLYKPEMAHGLDALAERYLGYKMMSFEEMIAPQKRTQFDLRQVPIERLGLYASEDALITYRLYEELAPKLQQEGLGSLMYELEMPLLPILAEMERIGIRIDREGLNEQSAELSHKLSQIEQDIYTLVGHEFNINSPMQVGGVLFDELKLSSKVKRTKGGNYSTSEAVLEKLSGEHPVVDKLLEYRGLKKLLSTYIDAFPELLDKEDKLHTTFNQAVVAMGRISSTNPNIQNIPIRTPEGRTIRKVFVAEPDCLFLSADYSQIELRLMAHLSGDEALIEAFRQGQDIHQATAARINGVALDAVTSDMRRQAKTANFGIIYGISAFGLSEQLKISRSEAARLIEGYFASYPKVDAYMKRVVYEAQSKGYVETLCGRRRYLAEINSENATLRGHAERYAINAPLQGTAADIIKRAMVAIDREIKRRGLRSRMILQVHDELNFNVYRDELEEMQDLVRTLMETALLGLSVPLVVGMGVGNNWLEAH